MFSLGLPVRTGPLPIWAPHGLADGGGHRAFGRAWLVTDRLPMLVHLDDLRDRVATRRSFAEVQERDRQGDKYGAACEGEHTRVFARAWADV
jgi:hypothetical protein